jgi:hypothetical protein
VSISEASRATGISRTQLYRLRDRGDLEGWLQPGPGRSSLIELEGLLEHCHSRMRLRVDSPVAPVLQQETAEDFAARLNQQLYALVDAAEGRLAEGADRREVLEAHTRRCIALVIAEMES